MPLRVQKPGAPEPMPADEIDLLRLRQLIEVQAAFQLCPVVESAHDSPLAAVPTLSRGACNQNCARRGNDTTEVVKFASHRHRQEQTDRHLNIDGYHGSPPRSLRPCL